MKTITALAALAAAALLTAPAAHALDRGVGARATVVGQGVEAFLFPTDVDAAFILERVQLSLPMVEALVPVGDGEILAGASWYTLGQGRDFGDGSAEFDLYMLAVMVGYAHALVADEQSAVRLGGRIGTGFAGSTASTEFSDGQTRETEDDFEGTVITVGAFLAGEYMFGRHFGLQAELGLDIFHATLDEDGDRTFGWVGTYTALSGVLRF